MAAIDIPDGYWTITPWGFEARAVALQEQLQAARNDVLNGARSILNGGDSDLVRDLALSDADEARIRSDAYGESVAIGVTPAGDVVARYGHGDDLANNTYAAESGGFSPPGPSIPNPPDLPPDEPPDGRKAPPPTTPPLDPSGGGGPTGKLPQPSNPPAPGGPPAQPTNGGPTFDQYTARMLECTGRPGSDYEWRTFWAMRADWYEAIYNSDEATNYRNSQQHAAVVADAGGYVTRDDLVAHLNALDATINILV